MMKLYYHGDRRHGHANAALLARLAGHEVMAMPMPRPCPPMSTVLDEAGIAVHDGYDPKRLEDLAPDLVVVGNAMSRGNPEVEWLLDTRRLAFTSLPAMLHDTVLRSRLNIVVCGTHGKTTTTALAAFLLRENGRDPGFLIGGVPQDPPVGSHLGATGDPFVIEGDEFDTAFFDKRSKFIHYAPRIAVLNNLEFDHADIFRDLADVQRTFSHLTRIVPGKGFVVMNGDDANLRALGPLPWTRVVRVGLEADHDVRLTDFAETPAGTEIPARLARAGLGARALGLAGAVQRPQCGHGRHRGRARARRKQPDGAPLGLPGSVSRRAAAPGSPDERAGAHGDRGFWAPSDRLGRNPPFLSRALSGRPARGRLRAPHQHLPDQGDGGRFHAGAGAGRRDLSWRREPPREN